MNIKSYIPWHTKIVAKMILSRLPFDYWVWSKLDLFKHGQMEKPKYAYDTFRHHFNKFEFSGKRKNFTVLELGPGDSLFSALIAYAHGATSSYLVDIGRFAKNDLKSYIRMIEYLKDQDSALDIPNRFDSVEGLLAFCHARYEINGLESIRNIPNETIDFIWSQAVLEHVRFGDFEKMMRELRRILKSDGVCSHVVDLKDHLSGALNNLRFNRKLWESDFMTRSGFYTNRLRYSEMLKIFSNSGFSVQVDNVQRYPLLPTPRSAMAEEFRNLPDEELLIAGFEITLRPN